MVSNSTVENFNTSNPNEHSQISLTSAAVLIDESECLNQLYAGVDARNYRSFHSSIEFLEYLDDEPLNSPFSVAVIGNLSNGLDAFGVARVIHIVKPKVRIILAVSQTEWAEYVGSAELELFDDIFVVDASKCRDFQEFINSKSSVTPLGFGRVEDVEDSKALLKVCASFIMSFLSDLPAIQAAIESQNRDEVSKLCLRLRTAELFGLPALGQLATLASSQAVVSEMPRATVDRLVKLFKVQALELHRVRNALLRGVLKVSTNEHE